MSFVRKDPLQFKPSGAKPLSSVTVPPPGAFTTREDAVTSLLSEGRDGSIGNKTLVREKEYRHITLKTRGGSGALSSPASQKQKERIATRNARAVAKHQQLHQSPHVNNKKNVSSFLTGTGTSVATSNRRRIANDTTTSATANSATVCLSEASHKKAKERELAAKLCLLQSLRDKDRELAEATELANTLLQRREEALEASQRQGLALLASVEETLRSPNPARPPGFQQSGDMAEHSECNGRGEAVILAEEEREKAGIKNMMRGTTAVEKPEQPVERVVVTRQLSRRKSLKVQESFGKDNMRSDGQLSAVFLNCMYHNDDSGSNSDSDEYSDDGDSDAGECGGTSGKRVTVARAASQENPESMKPGTDEHTSSLSDKENEQTSPHFPPPAALTTSQIVLQSTVPPWEAAQRAQGRSKAKTSGKMKRRGHGNTQVTVGPKLFHSSERLEDRVLAALESARNLNARESDNSVRTHFGYYYDSEEDESLRPVVREEVYIAHYFQPFGETFASTARPPIMASVNTEDDEGADFFNEFNQRELRAAQEKEQEEEELLPPPPKKMSAIGHLFSAMSSVEDDEGW